MAAHTMHVALQEPERREHLWRLVRHLGEGLGVDACSPIVPLIVGSGAAAISASAALLERGFYVPAIRPPTVAPGTSRSALGNTLLDFGKALKDDILL